MRDHNVDKTSGDVKRGVQHAQSASHSTVNPNSIIGLQGIIGNRAVQRLLASSNTIQRMKTIEDDVTITGNLVASTVSSSNNAMVWGDMFVVGNKGTVIANNAPTGAVPADNASGGGGQAAEYNPTEL